MLAVKFAPKSSASPAEGRSHVLKLANRRLEVSFGKAKILLMNISICATQS